MFYNIRVGLLLASMKFLNLVLPTSGLGCLMEGEIKSITDLGFASQSDSNQLITKLKRIDAFFRGVLLKKTPKEVCPSVYLQLVSYLKQLLSHCRQHDFLLVYPAQKLFFLLQQYDASLSIPNMYQLTHCVLSGVTDDTMHTHVSHADRDAWVGRMFGSAPKAKHDPRRLDCDWGLIRQSERLQDIGHFPDSMSGELDAVRQQCNDVKITVTTILYPDQLKNLLLGIAALFFVTTLIAHVIAMCMQPMERRHHIFPIILNAGVSILGYCISSIVLDQMVDESVAQYQSSSFSFF